MICSSVELKNFRNILSARLSFCDGINILQGQNAQGKTNLLEALCYLSIGKSFRTQSDEEMIRFGEKSFEINLNYHADGVNHSIEGVYQKGQRKKFFLDKGLLEKKSDVVGQFKTVLFTPGHLGMVQAGPGERRRFLDIAISQMYPLYLGYLQKYNRYLAERNQLLKIAEKDEKSVGDSLSVWSEKCAEYASEITVYRAKYLQKLEEYVKTCFDEMTNGKEKPQLSFDSACHLTGDDLFDKDKIYESYKELLLNHTDREIAAGSTLWGTHKDDIGQTINEKNARAYCSQGQQRSLALAMKLGEGSMCQAVTGETPVLLLDDVFSELDKNRRQYLSEKIKDRQVIITTCENTMTDCGKNYVVENGVYQEV